MRLLRGRCYVVGSMLLFAWDHSCRGPPREARSLHAWVVFSRGANRMYVPPDVPAVEVRDLRKEFRRRTRTKGESRFKRRYRTMPALRDVTFTMRRGECVAVLGQNGSGKSTLVRLLSTLLLHDGGSARVFGHDVFTEQRAVQRLVNRVSVEASFFKKMSAAENLGYASRFYGMTSAQTRDEIPRILERVGFAAERRRADGEPLPRHAAEGRPGAGAPHEPGAAPARRAHDRTRPALEAGGAGIHHGGGEDGARRHDSPLHARPRRGGGSRRSRRSARRRRAARP